MKKLLLRLEKKQLDLINLFLTLKNDKQNETQTFAKTNFVLEIPSVLKCVLVAFIFTISNPIYSQVATTATWNLTSNGNAAVTGAVAANAIAFGSTLNTPTYSAADGVTTNGWSNDAGSLRANEYYEYKVTPTAGNILTVSSVVLNHSISNGSWRAAVYYSYDNFATAGVQIGADFTSNSTTQIALNLTSLSLSVPFGSNFTIRVYAWESDGTNRKFRNRNVVITGTTCLVPTITGTTPATRTGTGTVTLGATASAGTISWYANPSGGSALGTGTSFLTPSISTSTTYYVETVNGTCSSSPRTAVLATVLQPEINLQGNSNSITDGSTTVSTTNHTDFGSVNITAATLTRTFTIQNTGVGVLTISNPTISGVNAADFSITTNPATLSIAVGASTTFVVTFDPSAVGTRDATITIISNDDDESTYDFAIQGTGVSQEINLQGNATNIVDGSLTISLTNFTDFGSMDVTTGTRTRTYTIQNTGALPLTITNPTISGINASDFTVTTNPAFLSIPAGSSVTFVVTFNPSAIGGRDATINITNNDLDENPYNFAIQGTGTSSEINLQGNSFNIIDNNISPLLGNHTDFGSTNITTLTITRTFTIQNLGTTALVISNPTISGAHAADFSISANPGTLSIAAGSSTTFDVTFDPSAIGIRSATINIVNNDGNENPYDFAIQGTGLNPEINVTGNTISIVDGDITPTTADWTDFSNVTLSRVYTIENLGTTNLTLGTITFSGVNASEFTITSTPVSPVLPGTSTTFTVSFIPLEVGVRIATINIPNNDSEENNYDYIIIATGVNIDTDGDGVLNTADNDDDNDGITDVIECGTCLSDPFINGSFESSTPLLPPASFNFYPVANVPGWQTSPESVIELWSDGFLGVPAAQGNQFAELNANVAGTLYQTFCLNGASGTITWSIKHRARAGIDQAFVRFGSTLLEAQTNAPIVTMVDDTTAWGLYSGTYIIPTGQTQIVLAFQAGYTGSGDVSVGNFIDDVQITINQQCLDTDGDRIADIVDLDDENDGIPDIEEGGFKAYSNNTSTMYKPTPATWTDTNANGINDYIDTLITAGTYVIPDTDGDGIRDYLDFDSDNDTFFDVDEAGTFNGDGDITGDGKGDGTESDRDGILDLYEVVGGFSGFGTNGRAYASDTDSNGTADYRQLDSNNDGTNDIKTGLYGSLDANNNGIIDGTGDNDRDGITDTFDTNNAVTGSPRNLDRKLFLDFDGRNDYAQGTSVLGGLAGATMMAWINLKSVYNTTGVVVGQNRFQIRVTNTRRIDVTVNSTTVAYSTPLPESQWIHVGATYDGTILKLFVNGVEVNSAASSGIIGVDPSLLTIGRNPAGSSSFFKGKIDEVRIFNIALTNIQFQRMIYQEIQNTGSQVRGTIIPRDIGTLPFANVLRYYRMDAYKDDIIDDLTTPAIDSGTGMKIYNHKFIKVQEAPMPFVTLRTGTFAVAVDDPTKEIKGTDLTDVNNTSSIVQVKHNITEPSNITSVGMFVDPGITIAMNGDNKIQNDWYLKLDGKIDLVGKSQLVQTLNSELDVTSAGSLERDQQGQTNRFNYNYWSSPVSVINTTSNNTNYTVAGVMRDGTNPNSIQNLLWTSSNNSIATSPLTLSSRWIYKFQNVTGLYANWTAVGQNGALLAGQGYTMKGSNALTSNQNYTFVGKPNSGLITSPIAANNLNLSGNPYPSAIDVNAFIAANAASTTGAVYFWEHYNTNTSHNLLEYQGGYATRNLIGGVAPIAPAGISGLGSSSKIPGRYIPVGQGFFVAGSATGGLITFNNDQRLFIKEDHVNSNTLFRNEAQAAIVPNQEDTIPAENTFPILRLGLTSTNNYHRQILIGFMGTYATPGLDKGYDAVHLDAQPNDMYFMNAGTKLIIQGDGFFNSNNIYPISVKTSAAGNVKFMVDTKENFDDNQNIYIYDSLTDTYHNIKTGMFQIVLPQGTIDNRFSLRFSGAPALAESQCGLQLSSLGTLIATNSIAGITGYKFRVTNQRTGFSQELIRTLHWFSLTMLSQYNYGDIYTVEVATKTTGAFSGYGDPCTVTAPEVPSLTSQCGTTIASNGTFITTNSLDRVTSYRFEVTNMTTNVVVLVDNNLNWFRLNMLSNYSASTNFSVRVALFTTGVWSSFGTSCTITSPGAARTTANNTGNETVVFDVTASPNPFDNHFSMFLNSINTEDVSIKVYDMLGKLIEQRTVSASEVVIQEIGNSYPTGVYIVVVSQGEEVKTIKITKR